MMVLPRQDACAASLDHHRAILRSVSVATPKELSRQAFILPYWSKILNIELTLCVSWTVSHVAVK
jgi:hypothetical protein